MANSSDSVASHTQVFAGSIARTHRFHRTHLVFVACICQSHRADGKLRGRVPFNVHKNKSPYATFRTRSSSIAPYVRKPLATTQRLKPKLQVVVRSRVAMCFDVTQPRASDQKNSRPFARCSSLHTGHEKKVSPKMPESHSQIAAIRRDLARTVVGTTLVGRQDLRCDRPGARAE